ncbi:MAG TPA: hypothetical protein VGN07_10115 [Steroidobacteraceae bacterium]
MISRPARIASAAMVVTILMARPADIRAADEPTAASFMALNFDGACDSNNNRLWLINSHTFKTIATTVRWRAAGGKNLTEQFFPGPNSKREIGCAAQAEIIEAKFADF